MPAKPRTPPNSSPNPARDEHTPALEPPELSCAPRSAPEPDSQSPKNKQPKPFQPEQPATGMPPTPALCRRQQQHTRSLAAARPNSCQQGQGAREQQPSP